MSAAIKQYISTKYDQHPDMFKKDLEYIDIIRTQAINVLEPHVSGIEKLQLYAAQLVWIGGKFPIDVRKPGRDKFGSQGSRGQLLTGPCVCIDWG